MFHSWRGSRMVVWLSVIGVILAIPLANVFGGQSTSTDPDDVIAMAAFKRQRQTGTAVAFTRTQNALPKTATPVPTRTPLVRGTATPTKRVTATGTSVAAAETALAIRTYAQSVLGLRVDVTDAQNEANEYLRYLSTASVALVGHNLALGGSPKNYGALINGGGAVVSLGIGTALSGNLNTDVQGGSYATYTILVNPNGRVDTPTPSANIAATSVVATRPFDPVGTLTALPQSLFNLPTVAVIGTTTLNAERALDVAKFAFPTWAQLKYQSLATGSSSTYAWYAKSTVTTLGVNGSSGVSVNQTIVLYAAPSTNNKIVVSITVARGAYTTFISVP